MDVSFSVAILDKLSPSPVSTVFVSILSILSFLAVLSFLADSELAAFSEDSFTASDSLAASADSASAFALAFAIDSAFFFAETLLACLLEATFLEESNTFFDASDILTELAIDNSLLCLTISVDYQVRSILAWHYSSECTSQKLFPQPLAAA